MRCPWDYSRAAIATQNPAKYLPIKNGTLLCAYHAWRFDSQGNCVSIPQSKDQQTSSKHCSNSKSSAISYPTQERQGLLWVWAESGSEAQLESQLRTPRIIPELEENSDRVVHLFWNIRDLPYGWDFFMENVADPGHVPVSHHGIVGNRYKDANYYDMLCIKQMSTQEGFSFEITPTAPTIEQAITVFPRTGFWWALGGAALFLLLGYLLDKFSRLFYVYEFEHAHND